MGLEPPLQIPYIGEEEEEKKREEEEGKEKKEEEEEVAPPRIGSWITGRSCFHTTSWLSELTLFTAPTSITTSLALRHVYVQSILKKQ
jgi:hypothetical protein